MREYQRINTPTALGMNRLLWGDWKQGEYGLIVRMPDAFDSEEKMEKLNEIHWAQASYNSTALLPTSFLHASLRASNALIINKAGMSGFIIGSKLGLNQGHHRGTRPSVEFPHAMQQMQAPLGGMR